MLEERNLKIDLLALGLLATVIFLSAALLSYNPADPPTCLVFPPNPNPANVCGQWGALASRLLFEFFGVGAYYVVFSLALFDAVLLTRRVVDQPGLRTVGWLLSLVGVTTLSAMTMPSFSPGPAIGPGGYLGATGRALLQMQFANTGTYIITVSLVVGGLFLCTDYLLVRLFALTIGRPGRQLGRGMMQVGAAYAQKMGRKRSDLDGFDQELEPVLVRKNGRAAKEAVEVVDDAAEVEDDEVADDVAVKVKVKETVKEVEEPVAEEEEQPEETPEPAVRKTLGSRVGIGRPKKTSQEVLAELDESEVSDDPTDYELPSLDLLLEGETVRFEEQEKEVRRKAKILEKTFLDFGFHIRVVEIQTGPVIAQYEVELEAGLRLSRITGLADDLAIALRVPSVRIVAPLPGKNTVGIEVPNNERQIVRLREVMEEANGKSLKMRIPIYLGKDVAGSPLVVDLSSLPHLLIAGRTGTGKSVCLNSIIVSMMMTRRPDEVRMLMIDPKMVELSPYKSLPHLMHPVVTDMRKAEAILGWAVEKMEERYHLLARAGVRHISAYNQLGEDELMDRMQPETEEDRKQIPNYMPYIVIVADELADLMMTAAKEVETHIIRLAQKSRAVGIHLVLATQKPTVDVITGLIKSNLPARIAFQVASRTDSRVVLDEMGADKLLGNGDMLFLWPGTSTLLRGQGTYLSDEEINRVIGAVATDEPQFVKELVQLKTPATDGDAKGNKFNDRDELYEAAIDIVIREGRGSVSLLQRSLGIGYGRAARLIDFMAEDGVVGPYNGSQAREVVITLQQWEEMSGQASSGPPVATPKPRPSNKILLESPGPNARATAGDSPSFPARSADKFDDDEDFEEEDSEEEDFDEEDVEEECDEEAPDDEAEQDEEYDELDASDDEDGEIDECENGEDSCVDSDNADSVGEDAEEEEQACEELGPEDYFDEDEGTYRDDNSGNKRGGNESKRRIANKGRTGRLGGSDKQDGQPKVSPPNRRWKAESA